MAAEQRLLPLDVRAVLGVALPQRALRLAHKLLAETRAGLYS